MRFGLIFSILLHLLVFAAFVITIRNTLPLLPEHLDIPVEVVDIAEVANVKAATKEKEPEVEPPAPEPEEAPPPVTQPEAAPEPEPEPAPETPKEEPKPQTKPQQKPTPPKKPDEKKDNEFDLDAITKLIDRAKEAKEKEQKTAEARSTEEQADKPRQSVGSGDAMTITLVQSVQRQVGRCWNFPLGAVQPEELNVGITISLRRDGTLAEPPSIDEPGRMSEPYFKAAAEAAVRAINQCQPYDLPAEQYDIWKELDLFFDPSKMIGLAPE